ncbi:MAG: hypothetical protein ACKO3R_03595 [bacterium]
MNAVNAKNNPALLEFLEQIKNKIPIRFPSGIHYAYTEKEAMGMREEAKIAFFYDMVLATTSATQYASIAKSIWGEDSQNISKINLPAEIESAVASALEADRTITKQDLNGNLRILEGHPSYENKKALLQFEWIA